MDFYYFCTRIFSLGLAAELLMNQVIESFKAHGSRIFAYGKLSLWNLKNPDDESKRTSVSHAKHGLIREICEIRVPYYLEKFVCQDCMRN